MASDHNFHSHHTIFSASCQSVQFVLTTILHFIPSLVFFPVNLLIHHYVLEINMFTFGNFQKITLEKSTLKFFFFIIPPTFSDDAAFRRFDLKKKTKEKSIKNHKLMDVYNMMTGQLGVNDIIYFLSMPQKKIPKLKVFRF